MNLFNIGMTRLVMGLEDDIDTAYCVIHNTICTMIAKQDVGNLTWILYMMTILARVHDVNSLYIDT